MMKVAIHQPNYLPYLGFFDKMKKADVFVIYDTAQFSKGDFHHRNKIRIFNGWKWLTVPVEKERIPIKEIKIRDKVKINKGIDWKESHLKNIRDSYIDTPYYKRYENEITKIYMENYDKLIDLNMELINLLKSAFKIDTEIIYSSDLGSFSTGSKGLLEIIKKLDGDVYLSGQGGKNYLDVLLFEKDGIKVEFQNFVHPVYNQLYKGFIPNMSSIDALFNEGKMPE